MKITGYRTLTEKERDYLTIHRLLHRYGMKHSEINEFLKDGLSINLVYSSDSVEFCVIDDDFSSCYLHLNQLPEGTTKLLIESE